MIQITETMIERGAVALRDEVANRAINDRGKRKGVEWHALPATLKDTYRREAEVVLRAAFQA